jgi:hypothetical protein
MIAERDYTLARGIGQLWLDNHSHLAQRRVYLAPPCSLQAHASKVRLFCNVCFAMVVLRMRNHPAAWEQPGVQQSETKR